MRCAIADGRGTVVQVRAIEVALGHPCLLWDTCNQPRASALIPAEPIDRSGPRRSRALHAHKEVNRAIWINAVPVAIRLDLRGCQRSRAKLPGCCANIRVFGWYRVTYNPPPL